MPGGETSTETAVVGGRRSPRRVSWLAFGMAAAVLAIGAVAYWDEERESAAALEDFAQEQATLARSVAASLRFRLGALDGDARDDGGAALARGFASVERPGSLMVLLRAPGSSRFWTTGGQLVDAPLVLSGLDQGRSVVRLPPSDASALGMPRRTAMAGLAWVEGGAPGSWSVAVVANAQRVRDREQRARWRLALATLLAGGLVLVFGGSALRRQRKSLEMERELAIAALQRDRDERLERADRAATLGTFAMGITHELSTPLGVIAGRAEQILQRVEGDPQATRFTRAILDQTERIHQVVRAFLGLARGDAPPARELAPADLASRALALCEHRFARAGVTVAGELPEGLPAIRGDASLIEHAIVNLLLNACDASERGGEVHIGIETGDGVTFVISDSGVGIGSSDALRVTEPFFTTKPSGQGSGLGLAIVAEIAKHHRGTLTLAPRKPRGTVARLGIPAAGRGE